MKLHGLMSAVTCVGENEDCPLTRSRRRSVGSGKWAVGSDKADAASQKLQIKNTRDTKGHEGEREKRAEEMLLSEQMKKLNFVLEREKKKLRVGKSEWRGERRASAPIFSSATACAGNNTVL